jgi:DNA (cytosine-5)-methyltransferase 1
MIKSKTFQVLDLFCGTGALSFGLHARNKSFMTIGGIDLDFSATETAKLNHKEAIIICDKIENIAPDSLLSKQTNKEIDLIVGGPPCQGFSSLRPSRGLDLDDPRNGLYKEFIKYVAAIRPTAFLMENVNGLIGANDGRLLKSVLTGFQRVGYEVDWRILNAANFGIPQKRERVFVIGVKKSATNSKVIFPLPTHQFDGKVIGTRLKSNYLSNGNKGLPTVTVWDAISDLPSLLSGCRSEQYGSPPQNQYQLARRQKSSKKLTLHEAANHSAKMLEIIKYSGPNIGSIPSHLITSGYSSCYSRLSKDEPSTTITVKFTSPASSKCIHPIDHRSITPREAARIQGFDDRFQFFGSKTDIASQIGNAVPPILGGIFADFFERVLDSRITIQEY